MNWLFVLVIAEYQQLLDTNLNIRRQFKLQLLVKHAINFRLELEC